MTCVPGSFFSPTSFILVKLSMEKFFFNHGLNNEGRRMYRTIISVWRTIPKPQITFCCLFNITSLYYLERYPKQKFVVHICPILDFLFGTAWIFPDFVRSADFSFVGWFLNSPCREGGEIHN